MRQYYWVNVNLSNFQLIKFKSASKMITDLTLIASSSMIGYDETNSPCNLLLADWQVLSLPKVFTNKSLVINKLCKTQLSKVILSDWVGSTAAASAADSGIHRNLKMRNNVTNYIKPRNERSYENS